MAVADRCGCLPGESCWMCRYRPLLKTKPYPAGPMLSEMIEALTAHGQSLRIVRVGPDWWVTHDNAPVPCIDSSVEAAIRALYAKERDGGDSLPEAVHEPPPPAPPPGEETWGEEILPPRGLRKLRRRLSDRLRALYAKRADA